MKTVTMYQAVGTNAAKSFNRDSLARFVGPEYEIVPIAVPWLEEGDRIIISKCIGSVEDKSGISSGGTWVDIVGTWKQSPYAQKNVDPHPFDSGILEDDAGRFIQCVSADMTYDGFPYRHVRLVNTNG